MEKENGTNIETDAEQKENVVGGGGNGGEEVVAVVN